MAICSLLCKKFIFFSLIFEYFEDTLIYGLIIAKLPFDEFVERLDSYLSKCDSWAHIDSFVSRIKCAKKEKERFFEYPKWRLFSKQIEPEPRIYQRC